MFDLYISNGLPYLPKIVLHLLIEINALSIDQLESFGETLFDFYVTKSKITQSDRSDVKALIDPGCDRR